MQYIQVGLTPILVKQLKRLSHAKHASMSGYMRDLLKDELRRRKAKARGGTQRAGPASAAPDGPTPNAEDGKDWGDPGRCRVRGGLATPRRTRTMNGSTTKPRLICRCGRFIGQADAIRLAEQAGLELRDEREIEDLENKVKVLSIYLATTGAAVLATCLYLTWRLL